MPSGGNNRINFQVGFNVDKSSLDQVSAAFEKIRNFKPANFSGSVDQLKKIKQQALQVENALNKAFNQKLRSINFGQFKKQLGDLNIGKIYTDFNKLGATGKAAFETMSTSILTTNLNLKQTSSFIQNIGTTLMNTAKWTVASSAIRAFTGSISQAFTYVKSLDSSLNDIRIVTKDSADEMANFATQANRAATELGRSTLDYTKAALTFYQQGLDDQQVMARTQATLKAQNITGAGAQMADYLTAVWNGYKVANEQAELYVDKLAAVADSSASNMSQLAVAMSKVASSANLLGVPVDSLNAQIATIVATTRQAPESVGNALKTIYSRINDISTGADDAEISLGNYSKKMLEVGVNVLDANGKLRNTGDVIEEIGQKWETLSHEQQIYLARTMAGQRQYNNLLALFENWGKYTDLVNISLESQGATAEKNAIYMESLAAHTEQLGAAQERLKSSMVDSDSYKSMLDVATSGVTLMANFIQSIGGGGNALLGFGSIFASVFSGIIAKEINNVIINMQNVKANVEIVQDTITKLDSMTADLSAVGGTSIASQRLNQIRDAYTSLSAEQQNSYNKLIQYQTEQSNILYKLEEEKKALQGLKIALADVWQMPRESEEFQNAFKSLNDEILNAELALENFKKDVNSIKKEANLDPFIAELEKIYDDTDSTNKELGKIIISLKQAKATGFKDLGFNELNNLIRQASHQIQNYRDNIQNVSDENIYKVTQAYEQQKKVVASAAAETQRTAQAINRGFNISNLIQGIAGIGQFASGIKSLTNIVNIWENESLSAGEKILQSFTSLSFAISMVYTGIQKMSTIMKTLTLFTNKDNILSLQNEIKSLQIKKLQVIQAHKETIEQKELEIAKVKQQILDKQALKDQYLKNAAVAKQKELHNRAMKEQMLQLGLTEQATAFEKTQLYYQKAKRSEAGKAGAIKTTQLGTEIKILETQIAQLKANGAETKQLEAQLGLLKARLAGQQGFSGLLSGLGSKISGIFSAHPVLAWGAVVGATLIGIIAYISSIPSQLEKAQQKAAELSETAKKTGENLSSITGEISSINSKIKSLQDSRTALHELSVGTDQWRAKLAEVNQQVLNLINSYPELKKYLTVSANGQLSIGDQSWVEVNNRYQKMQSQAAQENIIAESRYNDARNDVLVQKVADKFQELNSFAVQTISKLIKEGKSGDQLIDEIRNGVGYYLTDKSESTLNTIITEVTALNSAIQVNNAQTRNLINSIAKSSINFQNISGFNTVSKDQQDLFKEVYAQQLGRFKDENPLTAENYNSGIFSTLNLQDFSEQSLADKYKEILQENLKMAIDEVVEDDSGNYIFKSKGVEIAKKTVAEISDGLEAYAFEKSEQGKKIAERINKLASTGIEGALSLAGGVENIDVSQLSQRTINKLIRNKDSLANALGIDPDVLEAALIQTRNKIKLSIETFAKTLPSTVQDVFNNLDKSNMSQSVQKQVGQFLVNALNKGIDIRQFEGLFSGLNSEQVQKIFALDFDYNTGTVQELQKALKEAGISTNISTEALQAYINAQKEAANSSEILKENYTNLKKIADNIKDNGIISEEDAEILTKAGINLEDFFDPLVDGTWQLREGAKDFYDYINNQSLDGFKNQFEQLKTEITEKENFKQEIGDRDLTNLTTTVINPDTGYNIEIVNQESAKLAAKQLELLEVQDQRLANINQKILEGKELNEEDAKILEELVSQNNDIEGSLKKQKKEAEKLGKTIENTERATKKLDSDIKQADFNTLTEYFNKTDVQGYAEIFQQDRNAAEDLAEELLRYDSALQKIKTKQDQWTKALNSSNTATQALAKSELKNVYADILGISEDVFGDKFLSNLDNLELLNTILTGTKEESTEAYNQLLKMTYLNILVEAGIDTEDFDSDYRYIKSQIDAQLPDLKVGAELETEGFINALINLLNQTATTKAQAQAILKSLNVKADVTPITKKIPKTITIPVVHYNDPRDPGVMDGSTPPFTYKQETKTVYDTISGWELGAVTKAPSAPEKYNPPDDDGGDGGGNPTSSTPKRQYIKKNPAKKPYQKDPEANRKEIIYDPYEKNTKQLEKESDILDKLAQQEQRISGKDRLRNLKAQNEQLEKQNKTLQERQKISDDAKKRGSTSYVKKQLQDTFGDKIKFDEDGQISSERIAKNWAASNYNTTEKQANEAIKTAQKKANDDAAAANKAYQDWRKKYNRKSAEAQQKEYDALSDLDKRRYSSVDEYQKAQRDKAIEDAKKEADKIITQQQRIKKKAEEQYQYRIKLIEQYGQLWKKDQQAWDQYVDNLSKILENKFASLKLKVDLSLQTGDIERQWLNFRDKFISPIKDNQFAKQASSAVKEMLSYTDSGQLQATLQGLQTSKNMLNKLQKGNDKTVISTIQKLLGYNMKDKDNKAAWKKLMKEQGIDSLRQQATALAQQQLKEYLASAQEQLIAMQEQAEKVREILLNAVNKWNEDMKSVISQYQRIGDIIDHNRKLSEMLFGDKAYDVMLKYYRKQYTNSNNQLKRLVDYRNQQMEQYQLYKKSDKERAQLALKNAQDYTNQINSLMENMVDNLQKRWEIAAESAIQKFRDGFKLDLANNEWDYINKFDNAFLDPVETKIGLEEIEALYNDAAKELSGNREQQERINKLGKQQLEQLKNKKNITKYDIERAKVVLDIEKQRYALQDAREKKVQIRLRRDSQGNYTYRYVSQAEEITNAQQAYAKAQYDLYEKDKQHYKGVLNDMNQLTEEYSNKRMELEQEMSKALAQNDTERLNRLDKELTLLDNWYEKLWKAHAEDKEFTLGQYLTESFSMNMNLDPKDADTLNTMKTSLDFVGSTLDKTIDKITKKGGLIEALKETFDNIRNNTINLIGDVEELGRTAGITNSDSESFLQALTDPSTRKEAGETLSAIGKIIAKQEKMITPLQQVVDTTKTQVEQVDKLLKDSNEFIKNLKEGSGIISQLLVGYNALQQSNDYTDNGITEGTGFTTASKNTVQYVQDLLSQVSENIKTKIMQLFDRPQSYATGGYTGDWGEQGRLAYLHEKELVLNANDTANILAAVGTLRDMTSRMSIGESLNALAAEQSGLLSTLYNSRQQLDQNVHIEANFPNVRDHLEIEKAFDNLINIASMYASKRQ